MRTPRYVRNNIPVSLLAKPYADLAVEVVKARRSARRDPSFYIETQGEFAERLAREMRQRVAALSPVKIGVQTDFSEPLVRINTDPIDVAASVGTRPRRETRSPPITPTSCP